MADQIVRTYRVRALVGVGLVLAAILATTAAANAASQLVGAPIEGTPESMSLGAQIAASADGTRIVTTAQEQSSADAHINAYELRGGEWEPLGNRIPGGKFAWIDVAMSADGSRIVVGDQLAGLDENGLPNGEVRVYELANDEWTLLGTPIGAQVGMTVLGSGVAVSGDGSRIAAGAQGEDIFASGLVRIFDLVDGEWNAVAVIDGTSSRFGEIIAMSADGSRLIVGNTGGPGQLHVFEDAEDVWTLVGEPISGTVSSGQLGRVVSISDDGTSVAARALISPDDPLAAHVSVFGEADGEWTQMGNRLTGQTRTGTTRNGFNDNFGKALSLSGDGNRLAISAPGLGLNGEQSGGVTVYEIRGAVWEPIAEFTGPHKKAFMGLSVVLPGDGSRLFVGTPNFDTFNNNAGQITAFDLDVPGPVCGGMPATLVGTAGIDRLIGTSGPDVIVGLQSNDIIKGLGGDDIICGGQGDDMIFGGQGFDTIFGAQGDDLIYASNTASELGRRDSKGSRIFGGAGNDTIYGSNRWDRMQGGAGDDTLYGYEGRDWIRGRAGSDFIDGGANVDNVHGGDGNDTFAIAGNDIVRGGAGSMDRCEIADGSNPSPLISCELR